jgi:hypothetical protein
MSGSVKLIVCLILVLVTAVALVGLFLKAVKVLALVGVGAVVLLAVVVFVKAGR